MPLGGSQPVNLITRAHFTLLYKKGVSIQMQTYSRYKTIHINNLQKAIYIYTSCTGLPGTGTGKNLLAQVSG